MGPDPKIMIYIIVDTDARQQAGARVTEGEALADVRDAVEGFGRSYAAAWGLAEQDSGGSLRAITEGDVLLDRALASLYELRMFASPPGT
jgi:hypothetical protein